MLLSLQIVLLYPFSISISGYVTNFFVECNSFKSFSTTDDATDNEQQPSGQASLRSGNVGENLANNADSLTIRTTASAPRVTSGANTNSNSNAAVTSSSAGSTSVTNGPPGGLFLIFYKSFTNMRF